MKPLAIVALCVTLSTAAALLATTFASPAAAAASDPAAPAPQVGELLARLEAVEQSVARIVTRLESLPAPTLRVPSQTGDPAAAVPVEAASDKPRAMDKAAAGAEAGAAPPLDAEASVKQLVSGGLSWEKQHEVWTKLPPDQQDRLLAAFEQRVKDSPHLASAHNDLGEAYIHRMLGGDFSLMMALGPKAEKAFDKALEIDDHHWAARFNKAMSLSHQPDYLGRRPEAIRHLETLVAQQDRLAPDDRHDDTYLILGNLLVQQGKATEAKAVWERGLKRHPTSKELREKLGQ